MISAVIKSSCLVFIFLPLFLFGQKDVFNQFETTKAAGEPPKLFKETFEEQVENRKIEATEISEDHKDDYAKRTIYSLNNILKSGYVLYGDPMTNFVQKVGKKLLSNNSELQNEIQFYVLKNNITNALCTDPGVIFITTGLLAQVENEAQLAFVMAHEIVHYQENHLQISFNQSKEASLDPTSSYQDLVMLSKDHEFEADTKALKLYHSAGYSEKEINTVFDVLMYSYLSFDEIEIDSSFFDNPKIYIPETYFPEKANPILAFDDYDDSKSTHPNIRKRKDAISDEIRKYDNWETNKNFISLKEFEHIQNLARFENVRENIILGKFIETLYEIYILEKQFPNNEYLQTTKAMAWTEMSQVSISGRNKPYLKDHKKKEGAISVLYGLFKKLNQSELALLAMRMVEDIHIEYPESKIIEKVRIECIKSLAHVRRLEINKLEKISYTKALALRENRDTITIESDSLTYDENETKYDRIRRIREQQSSSQSVAELIDENFSVFLLYDLVSNREFNELYDEEVKKIEEEKEARKLDRRSNDKSKNEKYSGDILMINPHLDARDRNNRFDLDLTLKFYDLLDSSIEEQAPKERLHNKSIEFSEEFTTKAYNDYSLLNDYILQILKSEDNNLRAINVDYDEMNRFIKKYDNPYLLLIIGEAKNFSSLKNNFRGDAKYIDLSTGKVTSSNYFSVNLKVRRASVGGLVYEALSKF